MEIKALIETLTTLLKEEQEKCFVAEITDEAYEQLQQLEEPYKKRISTAIEAFEILGNKYKNLNHLRGDLYEIKPKDVRAYFKYQSNRIVIIGFICLKKTQKAPTRYMDKAETNITNYINKNRGK